MDFDDIKRFKLTKLLKRITEVDQDFDDFDDYDSQSSNWAPVQDSIDQEYNRHVSQDVNAQQKHNGKYSNDHRNYFQRQIYIKLSQLMRLTLIRLSFKINPKEGHCVIIT